jgi:hypothetical protein
VHLRDAVYAAKNVAQLAADVANVAAPSPRGGFSPAPSLQPLLPSAASVSSSASPAPSAMGLQAAGSPSLLTEDAGGPVRTVPSVPGLGASTASSSGAAVSSAAPSPVSAAPAAPASASQSLVLGGSGTWPQKPVVDPAVDLSSLVGSAADQDALSAPTRFAGDLGVYQSASTPGTSRSPFDFRGEANVANPPRFASRKRFRSVPDLVLDIALDRELGQTDDQNEQSSLLLEVASGVDRKADHSAATVFLRGRVDSTPIPPVPSMTAPSTSPGVPPAPATSTPSPAAAPTFAAVGGSRLDPPSLALSNLRDTVDVLAAAVVNRSNVSPGIVPLSQDKNMTGVGQQERSVNVSGVGQQLDSKFPFCATPISAQAGANALSRAARRAAKNLDGPCSDLRLVKPFLTLRPEYTRDVTAAANRAKSGALAGAIAGAKLASSRGAGSMVTTAASAGMSAGASAGVSSARVTSATAEVDPASLRTAAADGAAAAVKVVTALLKDAGYGDATNGTIAANDTQGSSTLRSSSISGTPQALTNNTQAGGFNGSALRASDLSSGPPRFARFLQRGLDYGVSLHISEMSEFDDVLSHLEIRVQDILAKLRAGSVPPLMARDASSTPSAARQGGSSGSADRWGGSYMGPEDATAVRGVVMAGPEQPAVALGGAIRSGFNNNTLSIPIPLNTSSSTTNSAGSGPNATADPRESFVRGGSELSSNASVSVAMPRNMPPPSPEQPSQLASASPPPGPAPASNVPESQPSLAAVTTSASPMAAITGVPSAVSASLSASPTENNPAPAASATPTSSVQYSTSTSSPTSIVNPTVTATPATAVTASSVASAPASPLAVADSQSRPSVVLIGVNTAPPPSLLGSGNNSSSSQTVLRINSDNAPISLQVQPPPGTTHDVGITMSVPSNPGDTLKSEQRKTENSTAQTHLRAHEASQLPVQVTLQHHGSGSVVVERKPTSASPSPTQPYEPLSSQRCRSDDVVCNRAVLLHRLSEEALASAQTAVDAADRVTQRVLAEEVSDQFFAGAAPSA